jgi:L-alanine-DL-glutamate epimerase-like enolase superfamily enzyme
MPPGNLEAPLLVESVALHRGMVTVGTRPGLGADPDPAVLARYPYHAASARPFYLT